MQLWAIFVFFSSLFFSSSAKKKTGCYLVGGVVPSYAGRLCSRLNGGTTFEQRAKPDASFGAQVGVEGNGVRACERDGEGDGCECWLFGSFEGNGNVTAARWRGCGGKVTVKYPKERGEGQEGQGRRGRRVGRQVEWVGCAAGVCANARGRQDPGRRHSRALHWPLCVRAGWQDQPSEVGLPRSLLDGNLQLNCLQHSLLGTVAVV